MQRAMEAVKSTCDRDVEAKWLLHILHCVRRMYASLIHLDLPSEALDVFGSFILDLRYVLENRTIDSIFIVRVSTSVYRFHFSRVIGYSV